MDESNPRDATMLVITLARICSKEGPDADVLGESVTGDADNALTLLV